ncbi:N-acetyllactosaminide beta-1,3-N-acetylglucosaminyltransferase 2-like [Megalops cyprinoides]|uniref:N-acetyllactosaminide beta-1,3-N-acetylglucosaminyltransferase 2-like n=1 Tax=Megalops cyprinoides TaxID=118141 RepID=UPI0018651551|nr:N-acetyllactosaminide beta-1,3-N-acetylglucosaminyltransferase 2-like [Megalops cyprinoides]
MPRCRLRRLLCFCVCLPCLLVGNLFIYVTVSVCMSMSMFRPPQQLPDLFIAPGASETEAQGRHPVKPFWDLQPGGGALWNRLQLEWDRKHNPILGGTEPRAEGGGEGWVASPVGPDCHWDRSLASGMPDFGNLPGHIQEFVFSMHCREYPLLTDQPGTCGTTGQEAPMLLLAIKSEEGNFENRQAIRQTWGQTGWVRGLEGEGGEVRRVFLLAKQDSATGPYADVAELLELEKVRYQDILQWDFKDTFYNLTLKDVLFLRWFSNRCPRARFVFKGDDDVFVRTPVLLDFLAEQEVGQRPGREMRDFFVGDVIGNAVPLRQASTKYYIPESFYKGQYPWYAGGGGVVYSGAMALRLRQVSERVRLFPIDDVYMGMCLRRLGLSPIHHHGFLTFDFQGEDGDKPCAYHSILLVHKRGPKDMLRLWEVLKMPRPDCANHTKALLRVDLPVKATLEGSGH